MPFATSRQVRIYYEVRGPQGAPPIVLIRGLARSSRYWLDFLPRMARAFRVITLDNRGVGRSDAPKSPFSTRAMADDVAAVMDHAQVSRAHIFGMSLGGMISMRFALRHPDRVNKLVLGCTTMGGRRAIRTPLSSVRTLLLAGRLSFADAMVATANIVLSDNFISERPDILNAWRAIAISEPVPTFASALQLIAAAEHDVSNDLRDLRVPTLVITGDADRLISWENSRLIASEIPDAQLRIVPGAGHDFTTEQPELVAGVLERFLLA